MIRVVRLVTTITLCVALTVMPVSLSLTSEKLPPVIIARKRD
ncbi:hypothetical protein [Bacillus sp. EB01]|nr:hypothetical protein [Bacillus sp. EB01]